MIGPVDGGANDVIFDPTGGYDFEGGNPSWLAFFQAGGNDSQDLLLTPAVGGQPAGTVNTTANFGRREQSTFVTSHETREL